MAVLETIRVKLGIFISVIIALALLSFIIDPTTLSSVAQSMSSKYDVGEIDGKSISYQDFQSDVEKFTQISEIVRGAASTSEQQEQINNAAWQSLLDKYLFIKNAKAAGIKVGEEEMVELTTGSMISPLIANDPVFCDENGNFSSERLIALVQNADADESGRIKLYWDYVQSAVASQQYYSKYGSIFSEGNFSNALMSAKAVEENNTTANVEFVMVPFGFEKDSTIVVSDNEIKNYYKDHKKAYKQLGSRDIEYVVFEVVPSQEDINATSDSFTASYDEFCNTENMKGFLLKNSDRQYSEYWYAAGELATVSKQVSDFVDGASAGEVSPIMQDDVTFYAAKVLDSKMIPNEIEVKIVTLGNSNEVSDSLLNVLNEAEPFTLTQSTMIPGCESLFTEKLNFPVQIKTTMYGNLLAIVTSKSEPVAKKQVAIFAKETLASKETYNKFYSEANTLATKSAGSLENYKAAVAEAGLVSTPVNKMLESAKNLGPVDNTKEITRWAFEQKKAGVVSNIITVNNNYFYVVALDGIHKEGYAPVNEVANVIKVKLYADKLSAKKAAEVAEKIEGLTDMQAIADALGTTVSTKEDISFASSQGLDNKFIGAVSAAEEGKISAPVAGNIGVYVFKVTGREVGSFYSETDAKRLEAQKASYNAQLLLPTMMDDAEVVDHRARFF